MEENNMNEDKVKEVFSNNIWTNYGYDYCSYLVARHIHPLLDIPDNGYIVQIGSGLGLALERLCVIYGYERVIGYDWANPLNHPNVKITALPSLWLNKSKPTSNIFRLLISQFMRVREIKKILNFSKKSRIVFNTFDDFVFRSFNIKISLQK